MLFSPPAMHQRTIRKPVTMDGVGLHSGRPVRITMSPAPPNSGITFRVASHDEPIPAAPESVVNCHYATTIGRNGTRIQTVEHLMAAAAGLGIDNLDVEVDGPEIPAGDGSAKPFVTLLATAGRAEQSAPRRSVKIPYPIRVGSGGRWIQIVPSETLRISYTLDNDHPAIGTQALTCAPSERMFIEEFAPARTYGFLKDLGLMRKNGLARGASLENAIGVGKRGVLNGLRYRDEFVRHKILDLIGDLALLGRPVVGHVIARNAGHALNFELVLAVQRALGLERRPAGAGLAVVPLHAVRRNGALVPAPGLAAF
ncbi:MAG: UDP-3-O-[3-hydroxymyristoyl] N-acetylglucosamine deacetylase [Candidatus Rokubacteria bacterium 13_1_40CM_69_27]|nr:MAG: UDP-3-O-[3-hydroxymyristoyl] N-acetylglucosamine deacetylase [Candidatus Rokubacteria bacterium 13_1_40CM_69_27]OLE36381.1 MAG: UDP-3-O-[3-hydroxymyristoyl] N-acetylglucosamine deacetylase [Candidatus Rokubacteria bacterium 13_1_20CM_2_70_7]